MKASPPKAPARARTAAVITHTHPEQTSDALVEVIEVAREHDCTLLAGPEELSKHGAAARGLQAVDGRGQPDLCIVLGGDGTILWALRTYAGTGVPVFAINFGTIGFLAAVEREQARDGATRALSGAYDVIELPGLAVELDAVHPVALNDVTFVRRPEGRVAELSYSLAGQEIGHVRCDGLVAATPAGSTGYNLANHGPILAWGVEGYVVSFISPHTLTARPLVVAPDDALCVRNAAGRDPVEIALDGEHVGLLSSGAELEVTFREEVSRLAQMPGSTFYERIREKFGHLAG